MRMLDRAQLKAALRAWVRDAMVLATFLPPLRRLLARLYDVAITRLSRSLAARPYVREVGLTGSLAAADAVFGASDIDLIVIAKGRPDQGVKREIRKVFARARLLFPFVGDPDERTGNLLFGTDVGTNPTAAVYACRHKAGSYRRLWGACQAPGADVDSSAAPRFTAVEVVAEVALQLQSIATATLARSLNLYFWKSKIRVLDNLLQRSGEAGARYVPSFDGAHAELLQRVRGTPNHRLYFQRGAELDALGWDIVLRLIDGLTAAHDLERLATTTVDFRVTPARQTPIRPETLPPTVRAHHFARQTTAFGGDSLLNSPLLPYLLLEAADACWGTFEAACMTTREPGEGGLVLLWLGDWVFQLHRGRCRGVFSRFDRPWLFPDRFTGPGKLTFPSAFLDRLLAERDLDLSYLREAFYWRIIDREASDDPARHSDSLRYFEDRQRVLNGFAFIHTARCLSRDALVSFGERDHVFADAAQRHPWQGEMLVRLQRYARAVEQGTLASTATTIPPALLAAARHFFADLLYGRGVQRRYGPGAPLTLSLCVCTRDRARLLAALLGSVVEQTRRPDEVLIVDNGSTDDTPAVVMNFSKLLPLRHVVDAGETIAQVRNRGLREASGEIVCFTDDDCILHPWWLHFIEESFMLEERIGIVGGRVLHHDAGPSLLDGFHRAYLGVRI